MKKTKQEAELASEALQLLVLMAAIRREHEEYKANRQDESDE